MTQLTIGKCYKLNIGSFEKKFLVDGETKHSELICSYFCIMPCHYSNIMDSAIYLWTFNAGYPIYDLSNAIELTGEELEEFKSTLKHFNKRK